MAAEHRVTRKQLLKEPDAFQVFSARFMAGLMKYRAWWITALVLLILGGAGYGFYQNYLNQKALKSEQLYFEMTRILEQGRQQPPEKVLEQLKAKLQEIETSEQKTRARLLLADSLYQYGKYQEALQAYEELLAEGGIDPLYRAFALQGRAHALESQKNFKKAIQAYKTVIDSPGSIPLFYSYLGLARSYAQSGDTQNAVLVLRDMKTKFPEHGDLAQVDTLLKRLEAQS